MTSKFTVRVKEHDNYAVLYTEGYINNIAGEEVAERFDDLFVSGHRKFVFNLKGSSIINSIGISILIEIIEKLVKEKGILNFCNLTPVIGRTFEIMGLTQYAKVYDCEEDAVKELG